MRRDKPAREAILQPAHPLARGLRACYIFPEGEGFELRSKALPRLQNIFLGGNTAWVNTEFGPGITQTSNNTTGAALGKLPEWDGGMRAITVLALMKSPVPLASLGGDKCIVSDFGSGGFARSFRLKVTPQNSGGVYFGLATSGTVGQIERVGVPASLEASHDGWLLVGGLWDGRTMHAICNHTIMSAGIGMTGVTNSRAGLAGNVRTMVTSNASTETFLGDLAGLWFWDRALTIGDRATMVEDPFCMFRRKVRVTPSPPPVGGQSPVLSRGGVIHPKMTSVG